MSDPMSVKKESLVLLVLNEGPRHGYEIAQYIESSSNGRFSLSFGSLYPILHRLEKEGLVQSSWERGDSGKEKKIYRLTAKGKDRRREDILSFQSVYKAVKNISGANI